MMERNHGVAIVGGGIAASEAAVALRRNGYDAPIRLICEERHAPYQRPPLSKAYLLGKATADSLYLRPQAAYDKAGVELILGTRAEGIDRASKTVLLRGDRSVAYDTLILATGGKARNANWLFAAGHKPIGNLHTIRTIDDVDRVKGQFRAGAQAVIIGGGYIGLEVAAAAVTLGLRVSVLERLPRVLARVTAPEVSSFYEGVHQQAGVDVRTDVEVSGFELADGSEIRAVHRADGETIPADLVIVGVGMVPNTELATGAGLAVGDGILVDQDARTSDADILAIGDCSNQPCAPDGRRVRLESQPSALEQARVAAATICGKEPRGAAIPWFWSDQYDLKLQIAGLSSEYDRTVVRGSMNERRFSVFYLRQHRVIAADVVNCPADFAAAKMLIARCAEVDPGRLSNISFPLAALV
jgi:3-phenylpropionate/trans-cinnamate dioxygenase ferredoxin reductase subunit